MKAIFQKLSRHWTLIWLIAALTAAGTFAALADYTGVNSTKRVVSTQAPNGVLFSSNSLKATVGNSTVSTAQKLSAQEYDITVCNYEQIKAAQPNNEDITYTLTATLQVKEGGRYYDLSSLTGERRAYYEGLLNGRSYTIALSIDDGSGDAVTNTPINLAAQQGYTCNFDGCRLTKEVLSTDMFRISFDAAELAAGHTEPDFYIAVNANPTFPSGINAIHNLYCASQSAAEASSWKGELLEAADCASVDYDFYNYILTGSGRGTIDVMWDTTMFEINPFFSDMEHVTPIGTITEFTDETDGHIWKKMTLSVNSTIENRYDIQLYKVSTTTASYTGNYVASKYVRSEFHEELLNNANNQSGS